MQDRRVLVTGATGHLGYHLVHALNQAGVQPRVLLRRPLDSSAWRDLRVLPYSGDLEDDQSDRLEAALEGVDTLFHLAALVSLRPSDARRIERVNHQGTIRLAQAAARRKVRRLIYVSTAASFGSSRDGQPRDESSSWNLEGLRIPYLRSKISAERWLLEQGREGPGFPEVVIANPSLLIGPPLAIGRNGFQANTAVALPVFPPLWLYVDGKLNLVDVRDVAQALIKLAERGRSLERYLLVGPPVEVREVLAAMDEFLPPGKLRFRLPRLCLLAVALLGALKEPSHPRGAQVERASLLDCLRLLDFNWSYSTEKARRELEFSPTPLRDSLRHLFAWPNGPKATQQLG